MKFIFNKSIYSWKMTGLLGKGNNWFLGFSKVDSAVKEEK